MLLTKHPVGKQADLGTEQRSSGDLEIGRVQRVAVLGDVPNKPTWRGEPQLADAVVRR